MVYTCVRQYDTTDCGAACLSTILRHYGSFIPIVCFWLNSNGGVGLAEKCCSSFVSEQSNGFYGKFMLDNMMLYNYNINERETSPEFKI